MKRVKSHRGGDARPFAEARWSRQQRRNSQLSVFRRDGRLEVRKQYHAQYKAGDESDAYARLRPLVETVSGIRLPAIHAVDPIANAICIEYVSGPDLRGVISLGGPRAVLAHRQPLLELFVLARAAAIPFDADPANFLVDDDTGELVLVDPVCQEMQLPDFVLLVFVFGLIKATIANLPGAGWWRCRSVLRSFCRDYCDLCQEATLPEIRRQLAIYLDAVIGWNRETANGESYRLKLARRWCWIPFLRALRCWLLWRAEARSSRTPRRD